MKEQRQDRIRSILKEKNIETQQQLLEELAAAGFASTQATVSRDMREMRIVKEQTHDGRYRYAVGQKEPARQGNGGTLDSILQECVLSCDMAQNLVVLRTLPGLASAACSALDSAGNSSIVGTLAGDDTALVVLRDNRAAQEFEREFRALLES